MTSQIMKICYWWSTHSQQICCSTMCEGITQNTLHVLNDCNKYVYVHDIARMDEHKTLMLSLADRMCKHRPVGNMSFRSGITSPFQSTSSKRMSRDLNFIQEVCY